MLKTCLVFILSVVLLCGCAKINMNDANDVYKNVKVVRDDYKKVSTYYGPYFVEFKDDYMVHYSLIMIMNYGSEVPYFYVHVQTDSNGRSGLRHYKTFYDSTGVKLEVDHKIEANGSTIVEFSNAELSPRYILNHTETGIKFKLYGNKQSSEMFIPGAYIKAMLGIWAQNKPSGVK